MLTGNGNAGAVNVIYGSSDGLNRVLGEYDQLWSQDSTKIADVAEADDSFGSALTSGDFNNDGYDDLAIGVPDENSFAGAVNVIYGSSVGLHRHLGHADQFFTQDSTDIADVAEADDSFGSALTSGDFNNDGYDDLAIGVSGENSFAGAVNIIYGSSSGLHASLGHADQFFTQDTNGIADVSEGNDIFGSALTSADFNNDGYDDLAIGVSGEDVGGISNAGAVNVIYGSASGLHKILGHADQFFNQDTNGVEDVAEINDSFGVALTSADFNNDGYDDLAIGVIGEDSFAGAVNVIYGSSNGLSQAISGGTGRGDQIWSQDSKKIADISEAGDVFGNSLTSGDFNTDGYDDLAIGVSGENSNAGAVNIIYGSQHGLHKHIGAKDQLWTQNSNGILDVSESGDLFGHALSG